MDDDPCECSFCAPNSKGRGPTTPANSSTSKKSARKARPRPVRAVCGGPKAVAEEEPEDLEDPPRKRRDIIIRNKKAIKCLSRKTRALKMQQAEQEKRAMKFWSCYNKKPIPKPKPKPPPKQSSMLELLRDKDDCLCELMKNVLDNKVSHSLALHDQRSAINAGSPRFTPPPSPPIPPPPPKRFYFF